MRRHAYAVLFLSSALLAPLAPACSSNGASSSGDTGDGGGDAAIPPNQLAGQPCDPTLATPCLPAPNCFTVTCAEGPDGTNTCNEAAIVGPCSGEEDGGIFFEAGGGADAPPASSTCVSDSDCPMVPARDGSPPITIVCGYSAFDVCSSTGVCVTPEPPLTHDGAVETACGCDGQPVPYVTDVLTSAPVSSPAPCVAPTMDSGTDAGMERRRRPLPGCIRGRTDGGLGTRKFTGGLEGRKARNLTASDLPPFPGNQNRTARSSYGTIFRARC